MKSEHGKKHLVKQRKKNKLVFANANPTFRGGAVNVERWLRLKLVEYVE